MQVYKATRKLNKELLHKILLWAKKDRYFAYFNPNSHNTPYGAFEHFVAIGNEKAVKADRNGFEKLMTETEHSEKYWIGYFSYELKNEIEGLTSKNPVTIQPHLLEFFSPHTIISLENEEVIIHSTRKPEKIFHQILSEEIMPPKTSKEFIIATQTSKKEYIQNCEKIRQDIIDGEYYELNYCIEYFANNCELDPVETYFHLNELSPMPFSCLCKFDQKYALCASPERFLKKQGQQLISQPIKGTIRRGKDAQEDLQLKTLLRNSEKEISENMMIVDLVRNDLSRSSVPGTVKVDEFFGIYTFRQVHQMISTVSSIKKVGLNNIDVLKNAFPMGSMTGAPKIRVMQAIDEFEKSQRGIYSGSIGYFKPNGDFDFNVVIRTVIYDEKNKKLSFHVGSAITYEANPEYEYEECLLKASSMMKILTSHPN